MKREELLKALFAELEGKAYNAEYHNYYYKEANQVIRAFFERTFPPAEGAEEIQREIIRFFEMEVELGFCEPNYYERIKWYFETYRDEIFGLSQKPLQPTAEGAEEMLKAVFNEIWDAPVPDDVFENPDYRMSFADAKIVAEKFATLHAQRLAEKMVEEKCKKCKYRGLPDSINEALNSGDGVYRP